MRSLPAVVMCCFALAACTTSSPNLHGDAMLEPTTAPSGAPSELLRLPEGSLAHTRSVVYEVRRLPYPAWPRTLVVSPAVAVTSGPAELRRIAPADQCVVRVTFRSVSGATVFDRTIPFDQVEWRWRDPDGVARVQLLDADEQQLLPKLSSYNVLISIETPSKEPAPRFWLEHPFANASGRDDVGVDWARVAEGG
jgi:hypothetical protein